MSDSDSASDVVPRQLRVRVVGLTTYLQQAQTGVWDVHASFLPGIYIEGVTLAGGIATLLPPQPVDAEIAGRVLDGLDGLIITGGKDVDPAAYGHEPHPSHRRAGPRPRRLGVRAAGRCAAQAHAGAGHLPRGAGPQRRPGRHAAPAPARRPRAHPPSAGQRGVLHLHRAHRRRQQAGGADRGIPPTRSAITTRPSTGSATVWWSAPATATG